VNRREFIKGAGALAVPAVIIGSRLGIGTAVPASEAAPITAVVFDERYSDCRRFADALARQGAIPFATLGDSAVVWRRSLRSHLASRGGRLAGLTTYSDLVVLQSCRLELQLRVLYQGHHDCRAAWTLTHRISGCRDGRVIALALARSGADWARSLASALGHGTTESCSGGSTATWRNGEFGDHPGFLVSWVLGRRAGEYENGPFLRGQTLRHGPTRCAAV
jgi:hypothetical protein